MSGLVLSIADRQPRDVQSRAVAAVNLQRERERDHVRSIRATGHPVEAEFRNMPATLDAWYRAQPVKAGRIRSASMACRRRPSWSIFGAWVTR
jgi:hypothetical protein